MLYRLPILFLKLRYAMLYRLPILFLKLRYAFFFIKKKRKGSSKGTLSPSLFLKMTCNLISLVRIPSSSCALNQYRIISKSSVQIRFVFNQVLANKTTSQTSIDSPHHSFKTRPGPAGRPWSVAGPGLSKKQAENWL